MDIAKNEWINNVKRLRGYCCKATDFSDGLTADYKDTILLGIRKKWIKNNGISNLQMQLIYY
jgi:hypothetical protein